MKLHEINGNPTLIARHERALAVRRSRRVMLYTILLVLALLSALWYYLGWSHARARAETHKMPAAYVVLNRAGDIVEVSPAAASLIGRDDLIGVSFTSLMPPRVRDRARQDFAAAVEHPPQKIPKVDCTLGKADVTVQVHELERGSRYIAELRTR